MVCADGANGTPNPQPAGNYLCRSKSSRGSLLGAITSLLGAILLPQLALAVPSFDPFADATGSGGTSYGVGIALTNQFNRALFGPWYARGASFPAGGPTTQPMVVAGNLSYPGLPASTGNSVSFAPANSMSACLDLNLPAGGQPAVVYYSFLLKLTDLSNVPTYATNNPFAAFADDPSLSFSANQIGRLGTRLLTKKVGSGFVLGTSRSATTANFVYEPDVNAHNLGDVLFVVAGYQRDGTVRTNVNLWINPASSSFGSITPPAPTLSALTGITALNTSGARAFALLCQFPSAPSGIIDDLRVGTNWASITAGPDIFTQPTNLTLNAATTATFTVGAFGGLPLHYQWQKDGADLPDGGKISGATSAVLTISNVLAGDVGSYALVISNSYGVITSTLVSLAVNDPIITTQPAGQVMPAGSNTTLHVVAVGTPTLTYKWYKDNSPLSDGGHIAGSSTANLSVSSFSSGDAGTYNVIVQNGLSSSITSSNAVLLAVDPAIISQPQSVTNGYGTTATFQVTVSGTLPISYQWHKAGFGDLTDGGNLSGSHTNVLTITAVSSPDSGTYSVTMTNTQGLVESAPAVLTVRDPAIISGPDSTNITAGATATFHALVVGSTSLTYEWHKNGLILFDGGNVSGTSTDTLTIINASTADQASYSLVVNGVSTETSSNATLTIVAPFVLTAQPTSRKVAPGSTTALAVGATGPSLQYQWRFETTDIPGATAAAYSLTNVQPGVTGTYHVVVSSLGNSQTSSPAGVTLVNLIRLYDTNLVALRVGDGAQTLSANGNTISVDQFAPDGTYLSTVGIPNDGPYGILALGPNIVPVGANTSITGNGLSRSADGAHLVIAGYNTNLTYNAPLQNSTALAVPRGIGVIDASAHYTLAIASTNAFSNIIWRGGITDGTNNYWGWGRSPGTWYFGADASSVLVQSLWANLRSMGLFNGSIYCVSAVSGNNGVMKLDGMPTAAVTPTVMIASGSTGSSDLDVSPNGNLIYLADDRSAANGGGVQRYEFDGANWNLIYTLTGGLPNGARYVAVDFRGANPIVYAVTTETDNNQIVVLADTGAGSAGTTIASAGVNQNFRGIRLGPTAPTSTTAPVLGASADASNLVLNWNGSYTLQSAATATGPYVDVINGTRPYTNGLHSATQRYFRLRR